MNCVFSAQRHGTVIDALVLSPRPSVLMQQAARLTKGTLVHLYESHRDQLATHLLSIFSASVACRAHLNMPPLDEADFRAACFCCTPPKTLESGWVCSSCLAIYCSSETRCRCYGDDAKPEPGADEASR
ncbi:TFIIH subunit Tfb4/p34 [Pelagophyceae sp. CCMP2097]|nr:TFIIH subunit Tfb4/p34 [Pelagophyceae sp. CCMP2097]